jgi:hypothetical protein
VLYYRCSQSGPPKKRKVNNMEKDLAYIIQVFAYRKISFHKNENWKDIKLLGLFNWGEVSKYLVGNPGKLKGFKKGLVKTTMRKENNIIWCTPTEELWDNYIQPILDECKGKSEEEKLKIIFTFNINSKKGN